MTATQLDILDTAYAAGPDPHTAAVLALIAGDPLHARDREAIVDAIRSAVRADGTVTSNDWRPLIPAWVYPRVVGATVNALTKAGVLTQVGWDVSTDTHGRNSGKPCRRYTFRTP